MKRQRTECHYQDEIFEKPGQKQQKRQVSDSVNQQRGQDPELRQPNEKLKEYEQLRIARLEAARQQAPQISPQPIQGLQANDYRVKQKQRYEEQKTKKNS